MASYCEHMSTWEVWKFCKLLIPYGSTQILSIQGQHKRLKNSLPYWDDFTLAWSKFILSNQRRNFIWKYFEDTENECKFHQNFKIKFLFYISEVNTCLNPSCKTNNLQHKYCKSLTIPSQNLYRVSKHSHTWFTIPLYVNSAWGDFIHLFTLNATINLLRAKSYHVTTQFSSMIWTWERNCL